MSGHFARELSIWADFNALDQENRVRTSLRFAAQWPSEGEWVWVQDDDGNVVSGVVERIDGLAAQIRLEMSTWRTDVVLALPRPRRVPYYSEMPQGSPAEAAPSA